MRTVSPGGPGNDVGATASPPELTEGRLSSPAALSGPAALRDPRVRSAVGNRAVGRMLARQVAPPTDTKAKAAAHKGTEVNFPGSQYEYAIKLKRGRASASFKISASYHPYKVVKTTGAGGTSVSVLEDKRSWEREGTKFSMKVIEAAAKLDKEVGHVGPVTIKLNVKALEGAVGTKDGELALDLNLLTASITAEGDLAAAVRAEYGFAKDVAPSLKVMLIGEGKVSLKAGDLLKLQQFVKAKRAEVEAAKNMARDADRAAAVEKELQTIEKALPNAPKGAEIKALENRYKTFQGYGKRQAKEYGSEAAYKEARAEAKAAWKHAESGGVESLAERRVALRAEKRLLTASLRKEARIITKARAVATKVAAKIEGAMAKVVVRVVGEKAAAAVGRFLLKAIPIINWISMAWDIVDLAESLWKLAHGGKIGEGPDGDSEDGTSETATSGAGSASAGGGHGPGGQPDGQSSAPPPPDAGSGAPTSPAQHPPTDAGQTGSAGGPGLGGPAQTDDADDDLLGPPPQLSKTAKEIADVVGSGSGPVKFDRQELDALASVIPTDLDDAQRAELLKHVDAIKQSGQQDPYEAIAAIKEEIERIKRGGGEEPTEVSINGKPRQDLSVGGPAAPPATPNAPGGDPSQGAATSSKPAKTAPPAKTGPPAKTAPVTKAGPAKAPTTLLPPELPEVWGFDQAGKKWDYLPGGKNRLESLYTLSDGLQVVVNTSEVSSEEQGDVVIGRLTLDLIVFELPHGADKDYPWKAGQEEHRTITLAANAGTGAIRSLESVSSSPWLSALTITEKSVVPKGRAGPVKLGGVTLRLSGLKDHSIRDVDGVPYHFVTVLLTPTEVTDPDAVMIDIEGHVHRFQVGKQVEFRDAFAVPGAQAKVPAGSGAHH
jgi:hypothetical protein